MDYQDFDSQIHAIILDRGSEYFDRGAVQNLVRTSDGWKADILGQDSYRVILKGRGVLEEWFCDCPHAHGPVCKHVAAMLFAVRERNAKIAEALEGMSERDMRGFVEDQLVQYPEMEQSLFDFGSHARNEEE